MISYFKYRRKLQSYLNEQDQIEARFEERIEKARGNSKETARVVNEKTQELIYVRDHILRLETDYLYRKAARRLLPTPFDEEFWEESFALPGTKHLNEQGLFELRKTLREERTERSKTFVIWVSALTGLIGALTGLAAVLMG